MSEDQPGPQPEYNVYRARRRLLGKLRAPEQLRQVKRRQPPQRPSSKRPTPDSPDERRPRRDRPRRPSPRRLLRWLVASVLAWLALSAVLFFVSAQLEEGSSGRTDQALSSGGSLLTGSTILVLGSDQRPSGSREPGASGPGRADSVMLLRARPAGVRRLSILRDSYAQIPGHGAQKINAAYALGGTALMISTVETFLGNGLEVNHVVEVDFERFPKLIDALGGVRVKLRRCVRSQPFGGRVFRLRRGEHRLNGRQALAYARVRKNACAPNEDDRARAARQQQVLSAIRARVLSPATFVRLPWVSWRAPGIVDTDMAGPALFGLFADLATSTSTATHVLRPSGAGPQGSLVVSEQEKQRAVGKLLGR